MVTRSRPDTGELLQGTLPLLILRVLSAGPNHGFAVARRVHVVSREALKVEEGSLYPALHRLEKRRCVLSEWRRSESNRRAKYYRLTPAGRARLKTETTAWIELSTAIGRVMGTNMREVV